MIENKEHGGTVSCGYKILTYKPDIKKTVPDFEVRYDSFNKEYSVIDVPIDYYRKADFGIRIDDFNYTIAEIARTMSVLKRSEDTQDNSTKNVCVKVLARDYYNLLLCAAGPSRREGKWIPDLAESLLALNAYKEVAFYTEKVFGQMICVETRRKNDYFLDFGKMASIFAEAGDICAIEKKNLPLAIQYYRLTSEAVALDKCNSEKHIADDLVEEIVENIDVYEAVFNGDSISRDDPDFLSEMYNRYFTNRYRYADVSRIGAITDEIFSHLDEWDRRSRSATRMAALMEKSLRYFFTAYPVFAFARNQCC